MTREEFNNLTKQEKIDLAFDRCKILWSTSEDNKTRNVIKRYARLSEEDEWILVCTSSYQNDWFGLIAYRFFGSGYHSITIATENGRKCFAKRITRDNTIIISNDDIPDLFLETIMFDEIPNGETKEEYLDKFDSLAYIFPQVVYDMSKKIPMDMGEYIKKSRENGDWLKPKHTSTSFTKGSKLFENNKTLTKINIILIVIAIFITLINILFAIC